MNLPERLTNAIIKLYNAFHNNELDAYNCTHCAVGNLCDNDYRWAYEVHRVDVGVSPYTVLNPLHSNKSFTDSFINNTGYSYVELAVVERKFLGYRHFPPDKNNQYKGLCDVIEYLCELDNVSNVMDIQSLFEFDEEKQPIRELIF